jgi:ATP-binding cassette subfamily G (WHITE) protein 2 (PDR)
VCSVLLGKFPVASIISLLTSIRSGCSTLLKTIAGETHGFQVSPESYLNYQGITAKDMKTQFRGEAIYTAEVDAHFPQLSVGDTLYFAALARAPRQVPGGVSRTRYAEHLRDVRQSSRPHSLC